MQVGSAQRPDNMRFLDPENGDGPHPPNEFQVLSPDQLVHQGNNNQEEIKNMEIGNPMDPKKQKGGFFYRMYKGTLKGFGYTGQVKKHKNEAKFRAQSM